MLARNVRVGRAELDIVAVDPGPPRTLVVVEVRSRSGIGFGAPEESIDALKVARLYRGAFALVRSGRRPDGGQLPALPLRVDLLAVRLDSGGAIRHIRGVDGS